MSTQLFYFKFTHTKFTFCKEAFQTPALCSRKLNHHTYTYTQAHTQHTHTYNHPSHIFTRDNEQRRQIHLTGNLPLTIWLHRSSHNELWTRKIKQVKRMIVSVLNVYFPLPGSTIILNKIQPFSKRKTWSSSANKIVLLKFQADSATWRKRSSAFYWWLLWQLKNHADLSLSSGEMKGNRAFSE